MRNKKALPIPIAVALALAAAMAAPAAAHRLDEYLQAARVAVAPGRVALEIDLTPGVSVATEVFSLIDRDADLRISGAEAEAYARAVLGDLVVEADGRALPLVLMRAEVPSRLEMSEGVGTIRLEAVAHGAPAAGRHRLVVRNNHRPEASVYLVNALKPEHPFVVIGSQTRDARQREVLIEYELDAGRPGRGSWLLAGGLSLLALVAFRRRDDGR